MAFMFRQSLFSDTELLAMIDAHYVTVRRHPDYPLCIYNYTAKAAYDDEWNRVTMACRGLICNDNGRIVARPFKKFFWTNHYKPDDPVFGQPFRVHKKYDGSLGIAYQPHPDARPMIATRGSFESDQAVRATEILWEKYPDFEIKTQMTYLFEIIYPQNRVVLDYGTTEDLVLLEVHGTMSGQSYLNDMSPEYAAKFFGWSGPVAEKIDAKGLSPHEVLNLAAPDGSEEGFVLSFEQEDMTLLRMKVKTDEYCRLHYEKFSLSNIIIWDQLRSGKPVSEVVGECPDEYYGWVKGIVGKIRSDYAAILNDAMEVFRGITAQLDPTDKTTEGRAAFAKLAVQSNHKALLFALWDDNQAAVDSIIYKAIRPDYEPAYIVSEEGEEDPSWNNLPASAATPTVAV